MPTHGDHNVLVTHSCAETGESICDVWLGTRSKIACMSWNLASLLILLSFKKLSGIDVTLFKAHSVRSASTSALNSRGAN